MINAPSPPHIQNRLTKFIFMHEKAPTRKSKETLKTQTPHTDQQITTTNTSSDFTKRQTHA